MRSCLGSEVRPPFSSPPLALYPIPLTAFPLPITRPSHTGAPPVSVPCSRAPLGLFRDGPLPLRLASLASLCRLCSPRRMGVAWAAALHRYRVSRPLALTLFMADLYAPGLAPRPSPLRGFPFQEGGARPYRARRLIQGPGCAASSLPMRRVSPDSLRTLASMSPCSRGALPSGALALRAPLSVLARVVDPGPRH